MEDASSEIEQTIALTSELAQDLLTAITGNMPKNPAIAKADATSYSSPRFGSVYFGPLDRFADGAPHFGMVRGGLRARQHKTPEVPFSPITTRKQTGKKKRQTVLLPPGTLPSRERNGLRLLKESRILLFIRIPISLRRMRELLDTDRMHLVKTLDETFLSEARTILAAL
mgnify:CR=1 FL=1|jgi:hypothetical protein